MLTEAQFNDVVSRIFLRFDKTDEKIDRVENQLRASIDHVGTKLDETRADLNRFQEEQHAFNMKIDERLERLESVTGA
jgi:peptidoglycan hydrolase CwlO-like protein